MESKTGFWRNFTLKKWIITSLIILPILVLGDLTDVVFFNHEDAKNILTAKHLFKNLFFAIFYSFWLTVWAEKSNVSRWLNKSGENKQS